MFKFKVSKNEYSVHRMSDAIEPSHPLSSPSPLKNEC